MWPQRTHTFFETIFTSQGRGGGARVMKNHTVFLGYKMVNNCTKETC